MSKKLPALPKPTNVALGALGLIGGWFLLMNYVAKDKTK